MSLNTKKLFEDVAYLGLMYGDALSFSLGGLSQFEAKDAVNKQQKTCFSHSALTTWSLLLKQLLDTSIKNKLSIQDKSLKENTDFESLRDDVYIVLDMFAKTFEGAAFRGSSGTLATTLFKVAAHLELGGDHRFCGSELIFTDAIAHLLPLAFLEITDENEQEESFFELDIIVEVISLTHRHSGVAASSAYWIGAVRAYMDGKRKDELLDAAMDFSQNFLKRFLKRHRGHLVDSISKAEGALAMSHAMIGSAYSYQDLLTPQGFDAREIPSRLIAAPVYLLAFGGGNLKELEELATRGGDISVVLPLLTISFALIKGAEHLPIIWKQRLMGAELLSEHDIFSILKTELQYSNLISTEKKQQEISRKQKSRKQMSLL